MTVRLGTTPGLEHLQVSQDAIAGTVGPDELLVRIEASSLNGHDYNVAIGRLPVRAGRILLTDAAGIVEAIGDRVSEFAVGDAVISHFFPGWHDGQPTVADFSTTPGDGVDGYARKRVVRPAHWFTHAPQNMTLEEAATLPTAALTAWRALVVEGRVKAGDSILVLGTGGVSTFAIQFGKSMGARVLVTSSSEQKLERARALGADHLINYRQVPEWGAAVREATEGRGVQHVIEVGGPGTLAQSIAACAIGGHIALIGVLTGISGSIPTARLMARQQRLHGITVGSRQQQQDMVRALDSSLVKPVIDKRFGVADLAAAFRYQESGHHVGKIGIVVD